MSTNQQSQSMLKALSEIAADGHVIFFSEKIKRNSFESARQTIHMKFPAVMLILIAPHFVYLLTFGNLIDVNKI